MERSGINRIVDGGSRQHGTVETRRLMRGDGLAQAEEAVWRHGGVDGREAWQGRCISSALRIDRWKMEVTALAALPCSLGVCRADVGPNSGSGLDGTPGFRC